MKPEDKISSPVLPDGLENYPCQLPSQSVLPPFRVENTLTTDHRAETNNRAGVRPTAFPRTSRIAPPYIIRSRGQNGWLYTDSGVFWIAQHGLIKTKLAHTAPTPAAPGKLNGAGDTRRLRSLETDLCPNEKLRSGGLGGRNRLAQQRSTIDVVAAIESKPRRVLKILVAHGDAMKFQNCNRPLGGISAMIKDKFDVLTTRRLPARLQQEEAAPLLGFKTHDIPILVRARLLKPLGDPALNAVKHFASSAILTHAGDERWLDKATKAVSDHWSGQNAKRRSVETARMGGAFLPA
jgi:hypothetical protein